VAITSATSGATIIYTTNNTAPTANSSCVATNGTAIANGSTVSVSTTLTLEAIGCLSGDTNSSVASGVYTITPGTVATPTFSPVAGTYTSPQSAAISSTTSGATFIYTLDNSTPTANSSCVPTNGTLYGVPVAINVSETLKAIGCESGFTTSGVASAAYTITLAMLALPTFSPTSPYQGAATTVTVTCPAGSTCCVTVDGTMPTTNGAGACLHGSNTGSVSVSKTSTVQALATEMGFTDSSLATGTYTIPIAVTGAPTFAIVGGTQQTALVISMISPTPGAAICYTTNGIPPTTNGGGSCTSGITYTTPVTFSSSTVIYAIATKAGNTDSAVSTGVVFIGSPNSNSAPAVILM
jgi:hypothetical protein